MADHVRLHVLGTLPASVRTHDDVEVVASSPPESADPPAASDVDAVVCADGDAATAAHEAVHEDAPEVPFVLADEADEAALTTLARDPAAVQVPPEADADAFLDRVGALVGLGSAAEADPQSEIGATTDDIMARVTDAFFALDADWQFTYVNDHAANLLDRTRESLVGEEVWEEFPEAVGSTFQREYEEAMRTQTETTFEEYFPPLDTWFQVHAYPSETGLSVYFRDVTDQRRAEGDRRMLSELAQELVDTESFEAGIETGLEAVCEHTEWKTGTGWLVTDDGDRERVASVEPNTDGGVVEARTSVSTEALAREEPIWETVDGGTEAAVPVVSDGATVAVLSVRVPEERDRDEQLLESLTAVAAELADLHGRVDAAERRDRRRRQFDAVFTDPLTCFWLLDSDGTVRRANDAAESLLAEAKSAVGEPFADLSTWPTEAARRVGEELDRAVDGEYVRFETQYETDDAQGYLDCSVAPVVDDEDDVESIVVGGVDVTERRRLDDRLREERNLNRRILETSPVGIVVTDADGGVAFANDRTVDLLGDEGERLLGGYATVDVDGEDLAADALPFSTVRRDGETVRGRVLGYHAPGTDGRVWLRISGTPLDDRAVFFIQDVTDRRRRETLLADLNEAVGRLPEAETVAEVGRVGVEAAEQVLDVPAVGIASYDEDDGGLALVDGSDDGFGDLVDGRSSPVWTAFVESDSVHETVALDGLGAVYAVPVGRYGVLLAATDDEAVAESVQTVTDLLARNLTAALDRADRESALRERTETLEQRQAELGHLNRINDIIRDVTQMLIRADDREEIEQRICERFVETDPYVFAWVGVATGPGGKNVPTASAGEGDGYLDAVDISSDPDEDIGQGPSGKAFQRNEPVPENDIYRSESFDPWRQEALRRGFRSSVAVPIQHRGYVYGVLALYAEEADVFDEMELAVLGELGETVGYAFNALERRAALAAETATELRIRIPSESTVLGRLVAASGDDADISVEQIVPAMDERSRFSLTVRNASESTVQETFGEAEAVKSLTKVADDGDRTRYDVTTTSESLLSRVLGRGAGFEVETRNDGSAVVTLRIPQEAPARTYLDMFRQGFDGVELLSRQEVDRPVRSREEMETALESELTDRQAEVLRTAHAAGFFEQPRESTGEEVADLLDVSQPTVNTHIRTAQRKLFDLLFDGDDGNPN
ncbi:MAG: PAS domain-containing protein [Halolamina sp.]